LQLRAFVFNLILMPYIKSDKRPAIDAIADQISFETAGELNYTITRIVHQYVKRKGVSYAVINEAVGVLEAVKLEMYRKVVASYEEEKIKENGKIGVLDIEK